MGSNRNTSFENDDLARHISNIRACRACEPDLPFGARPVIQASNTARLVIAGQAPGLRVHETGIPFNDPSGDRLRDWMGVDKAIFYDEKQINIIPMGFCYPGRSPRGGDLPPRRECQTLWHDNLFQCLAPQALIIVIGAYAHRYHLGESAKKTVTETVRHWRDFLPAYLPLPHPSPRNILWLRRNPWFEEEVVPFLRERVAQTLRV